VKIPALPAIALGLVLVLWLSNHHAQAIGVAFLGIVAYVVECAIFDMRPCHWCDRGKQDSPMSNNFRVCRKCGGSGVRKRLGRRLWERRAGR
jgi:rRNA maturation endonuclease Nob1